MSDPICFRVATSAEEMRGTYEPAPIKNAKGKWVYYLRNRLTGKKLYCPGVTTVLKQLGWSASGLMYWAHAKGMEGMTLDDARSEAADVGTIAHACVEADLRGHALPDLTGLGQEMRKQVERCFDAWRRWRERFDLELIAAEHPLVSPTMKTGGTFDVAFVAKQRSLTDLKTSKGLYGDHLCQIAAYGLLWGEAHPDEPIEEYHILRLGKGDASFHHHSWPAEAMDAAAKAFKHARRLYDLEKDIKGQI